MNINFVCVDRLGRRCLKSFTSKKKLHCYIHLLMMRGCSRHESQIPESVTKGGTLQGPLCPRRTFLYS